MAQPTPVISFEAVDPVILRIDRDQELDEVEFVVGYTLRFRKLAGRKAPHIVRRAHTPYMRAGRGHENTTVELAQAAQKLKKHLQYTRLYTSDLDQGSIQRSVTPVKLPANDPLGLTFLLEQEFDEMLSGAMAVLHAKYRSLPYAERQKYQGFTSYRQTVAWRDVEHAEYFPRDAVDYALEHHYFMGAYPREPRGTLYDMTNAETRQERMKIKYWLENAWEGWMFFIKTVEAAGFKAEDPMSLGLKKFQRHGPVTSGYDPAVTQKILDAWQAQQNTATISIDMES